MDALKLDNLMCSPGFIGHAPRQSKPIQPGEPSEHVQREHCHGLEKAFCDRRVQGCEDACHLRFGWDPIAVRQAVIEKPTIGNIPTADRSVYSPVANDREDTVTEGIGPTGAIREREA